MSNQPNEIIYDEVRRKTKLKVVQDNGSDSDEKAKHDYGQLDELDGFQKESRKDEHPKPGRVKIVEKEVKYKGETRVVPEEYETSEPTFHQH